MPKSNANKKETDLRIRAITVGSGIPVYLDGRTVPPPNWEPGIPLEDHHGSKRPGVFIIAKTKPYPGLKVEIDIPRIDGIKTTTLVGMLGHLTFKGTVDGTKSRQTVLVNPGYRPPHFRRIRGDMKWLLELETDSGRKHKIPFPHKTRLELYWIYDQPGPMFKKGVWVRLLRILATNCALGLRSRKKVIQRIINFLHATYNLVYDNVNFSPHFTSEICGGYFNLEDFLNNASPLCNCFDMAGAVQVFLGAIGIQVDYTLIKPFGYLNLTSLVGRGRCNNTYFLGSSAASEIVSQNFKDRGGFGNHAVCLYKKKNGRTVVLDATVGPFYGLLSRTVYLKKAVDKETALYTQNNDTWGTLKDFHHCTGIIDVHSFPCVPAVCDCRHKKGERFREMERIKKFRRDTGFDHLREINSKKPVNPNTGVMCDWKDPYQFPLLQDWHIKPPSIHGGCNIASKEWVLTRNHEMIKIRIYVSNRGIEGAKDRFLAMAASTNSRAVPFKKRERSQGGLGHFHVSNSHREAWIYYNVKFIVETHHSDIDIYPVCLWLQEQARNNVVHDLAKHLPVLNQKQIHVTPFSQTICPGQEIQIKVTLPQNEFQRDLQLEYFYRPIGLQLVKEDSLSLTFKAKCKSLTYIRLAWIDKKSLLSSSSQVEPTIRIINSTPGEEETGSRQ